MKKLVEQHKWEKMEEKMARQRVKEQIEQDKIARRAKFGIAAPTGGTQQMPVTAVELTSQQASLVQQPTKDYSQTRLQVHCARIFEGACKDCTVHEEFFMFCRGKGFSV